MRYAMLIYSDQEPWFEMSEEEAAKRSEESLPKWYAFFEELGGDGMSAFERVCGYARAAGLLVIADGKRGDIGSTARAYASADVFLFCSRTDTFGQVLLVQFKSPLFLSNANTRYAGPGACAAPRTSATTSIAGSPGPPARKTIGTWLCAVGGL